MPMDFLTRIRNSEFPLVLTSADDINSAAVLKAAALIEADIRSLTEDAHQSDEQPPATVFSITKLGCLALANGDLGREVGELLEGASGFRWPGGCKFTSRGTGALTGAV